MMRVARALRITMIVVAALGVIAAGLVGLFSWIMADPWFKDDVVRQIMPPSGPGTNQVVDETPRMARIFPAEMRRDAAMALLTRNGFACRRDQREAAVCSRLLSFFPCGTEYVITFSGEVAKDARATSQTRCL
jgi:hypothetical protein